MDSLEIKNITIPYDDFKVMVEKVSLYESMMRDLKYLIDKAPLGYKGEELVIEDEMDMLAKKYCLQSYNSRLYILKKLETEKEDDE